MKAKRAKTICTWYPTDSPLEKAALAYEAAVERYRNDRGFRIRFFNCATLMRERLFKACAEHRKGRK